MSARLPAVVLAVLAGVGSAALSVSASAHGPLFSPAPETIWKGGTELTLGLHTGRATDAGARERAYEAVLGAEYGLTADWEVGVEVPFAWRRRGGDDSRGLGDVVLDTKYQVWKRDLPGAQYKVAALLRAKLPTGDDDATPRLGSGSFDAVGGLVAGYESRRWYWFASGVYRANTEGGGGFEKGDRQFLSVVGGIRPVLAGYDEPDTVLMLEANWERAGRDRLDGAPLAGSGGWQLFLSPVVWWTYRQIAVRAGVQIPVARDLDGPAADYRARLELVYHF